ncbi:hypothetical protein GUJ93_ZPchr0013g34484 [Zizania palustris]|uniref:Uncharacterized protein n=1 Tax=Zizania palustris TaxID=103762 RepID=A0A8J5WWD0_ZIZPA|nr:hypothetical protein GUJ93_ZPchr0013g34484 [Zizania palustris]
MMTQACLQRRVVAAGGGGCEGDAGERASGVEHGKVCVLSIDGGGRAADGLLAGAALVRLEASAAARRG